MRTDPRYTRVITMLTCDDVPRLQNGGIALCRYCQRSVYFANGFLRLLARDVGRMARFIRHKAAS
jgi:hypothetical protein